MKAEREERIAEAKALVEVRQDLQSMALSPQNFGDAHTMAQALAKSNLVPRAMYGKPHDILLSLMWSKELGIGPAQGLGSIHVIEGRAGISAELAVALCMRSDECEFFQLIESNSEKATYQTKRKGSPNSTTLTWTIEDAQRAKLVHKDNWTYYPGPMLRARCSMALARIVYPDVILGIQSIEEMEEIHPDAFDEDRLVSPLSIEQGEAPEDPEAEKEPRVEDGEIEERPDDSELGTQFDPEPSEPPLEAPREPMPSHDAAGEPIPMEVRIEDAASMGELMSLVTEIQEIEDEETRVGLRKIYAARRRVLNEVSK